MSGDRQPFVVPPQKLFDFLTVLVFSEQSYMPSLWLLIGFTARRKITSSWRGGSMVGRRIRDRGRGFAPGLCATT